MHLLIEKCFQLCNTITTDHEENQDNATEPMTHLITPFWLIIFSVLLMSAYFIRYLSNCVFLSRYILLLRDSFEIIWSVVLVMIIYIRNPHLRNFILRRTLSLNAIQPQENQQIGIELQTI